MTLSKSNDQDQTVIIQIRLPLDLSIEVNKLRAETRSNNATVIADLIRAGLGARREPQPSSTPVAPKAKATPGRPVTTQPKANKQPPGPQVVVDPSKWTKNLADIPSLTLADLQEKERQRQLSVRVPEVPTAAPSQKAKPSKGVVLRSKAADEDDGFSAWLAAQDAKKAARKAKASKANLAKVTPTDDDPDEQAPVLDPFKLVS
jgi:hypothetical protein